MDRSDDCFMVNSYEIEVLEAGIMELYGVMWQNVYVKCES